ncbi:MAG: T9SS type A sorting domain-containing protein [Bacteroidetes bacterium]|nr:T9SS type A sorting domain-containing protein [Bacteroidota bacterium]
MKQLLLAIITLAFINTGIAQSSSYAVKHDAVKTSTKRKTIDVNERMMEETRQMITKSLEKNPKLFDDMKLRKTEAWGFAVGDTNSWWTRNMDIATSAGPDAWTKVHATCEAIGEWCYVFVETSKIGSRVSRATSEAIAAAFSDSTPADPAKGIYEVVTETFGEPFDTDNDPRIILFLLDIREEDNGGAYIAGYNSSYNEFPNDVDRPYSNQAEIFYLDCVQANLSTPSGLENGMGTTAHEFQHMVQDAHHTMLGDSGQETFFNEGCSEVSTILCGYEGRGTEDYVLETNIALNTWRDGDDVLKDYQRAFRYMLYYYEQFGGDLLTKFITAQTPQQVPQVGFIAMESALATLDTPTERRIKDITLDWFIANAVNDKSVDPRWGYDYNVPTVEGQQLFATTFSGSAGINQKGSKHMTFVNGENLTANFHYVNPFSVGYTDIVAIKDFGGANEVVVVPVDTDMNFPDFGVTYDKLQFIIMNTAANSLTPVEVEYTFSGTSTGVTNVELSYEHGVSHSSGLSRDDGDIEAVWFDAVPGGTIDSIKVVLSQVGDMKGNLHTYTGDMRPTPLGDKLISKGFTATKTGSEIWSTVDITSKNLSAEVPFVVSFDYEGTVDVAAERDSTHTTYWHTSSFLIAPANNNWFWRSFTDDNDNTIGCWNLLIRAYAHIGTASGTEVIELLPQAFNLNQNYPNPFNPTTNITYSIPEHSNVKLHVYDALGRQIATLVNEELSAGTYNTTWNGKDMAGHKVSSGIYFYSIETKDFVQTKKMIMLK